MSGIEEQWGGKVRPTQSKGESERTRGQVLSFLHLLREEASEKQRVLLGCSRYNLFTVDAKSVDYE